MPATRRRLSADVRREQILEAASALFIERGFESVKMADIAERLGTSRPNIYTYYPSTGAILDVVLKRQTMAYVEDLKKNLELDPQLGAEEILELLLRHQELLRLLNCGGGPIFQSHRKEVKKLFNSTTRDYLPAELVTSDFETKYATTLMLQQALLLSSAYEVVVSPEEHDVKALGRLIHNMLLGAYESVIPDLKTRLDERQRLRRS